MYILGVNWEQNSTASLYHNEKLLGCVSEERFSRVKNDEMWTLMCPDRCKGLSDAYGEDFDVLYKK